MLKSWAGPFLTILREHTSAWNDAKSASGRANIVMCVAEEIKKQILADGDDDDDVNRVPSALEDVSLVHTCC